jgi:hypothetical protein
MEPYTMSVSPLALQGGGGNMRDAIAQALMNVQNPQPRTQTPSGLMGTPTMKSPAAGASPTATTPGAPGTPPLGGGAPFAAPPQTGMAGGLMPTSMGQTMQPGATFPGGAGFAPPPLAGVPPVPQTPQMAPPPALGQQPPY